MKDLKFDLRGNLKPYERCNITIEEFEKIFFTEFMNSKSRKVIYENYINYVRELKKIVNVEITQWIDGSFVSRKSNPKDIDIVSFIDYNVYEQKKEIIEGKFGKFGDKYLFPFVDGYIVKNFPVDHKKKFITEYDKIYWSNWFSETKMNRANKTYRKGYVEVSYE